MVTKAAITVPQSDKLARLTQGEAVVQAAEPENAPATHLKTLTVTVQPEKQAQNAGNAVPTVKAERAAKAPKAVKAKPIEKPAPAENVEPTKMVWDLVDPKSRTQETVRLPLALQLKLEHLCVYGMVDGKRPSKNGLMVAGIEQVVNAMLAELAQG